MLATLHKIAAALAVLTIASFWIATVGTEVFGTTAAVVAVKTTIPYGFFLLIPAIAAAGGTGFRLAQGRRGGVLGAKTRRMPILAANGVLILIPAALYLSAKAQAGAFDAAFYSVQGLELLAGAVNLGLLALNIRDGRRMTAGRRKR